jgi:UDP-N-acetylmuramate dehydrogenase
MLYFLRLFLVMADAALTKMFAFGARIHRPSLDGITYNYMIESQVKTKVPLKGLSTFKIGGSAEMFFEVQDKSELKEIVSFVKRQNLPIFVLGGGSNVLFPDRDLKSAVIKMNNKGIQSQKNNEGVVLITAEAGEEWDEFVSTTIEKGFYGLENLSSIPGSVGATPVQNIGAYGVEVKDKIFSVEVFDIETLEFKTLSNSDCEFGYRSSVFKMPEGKKYIVTSVTFELHTTPKINISYKDISNYFKENRNPSPRQIRDAVILIRKGKFPDLNIYGTAGSFFKNIVCNEENVQNLKSEFPELPLYSVGEGMVKTSTAFILDKVCGLKGFREGNVGLYENQSLVVVNYDNASAEEVRDFVQRIKDVVKNKTGISIEEEVVIL